ncbi:hypothetical protein D3C71_862740 [compost metagenome]
MAEINYTLIGPDDSIVAQGMSLADAVKRMFFEGGHEIEFRPHGDDPEICLFYRPKDGDHYKPYPLTTAPKEPLTEGHFYRDAIMNWDHRFAIMTDTEAQEFLAEDM